MKIAFDVDVLAKQMSINDYVHKVADWGYKYIEQSAHQPVLQAPAVLQGVPAGVQAGSQGDRCRDFLFHRCLPLVRPDRGAAPARSCKLEAYDRNRG